MNQFHGFGIETYNVIDYYNHYASILHCLLC